MTEWERAHYPQTSPASKHKEDLKSMKERLLVWRIERNKLYLYEEDMSASERGVANNLVSRGVLEIDAGSWSGKKIYKIK